MRPIRVIICCVFNIMNLKLEISNEFLASLLAQAGSPSFLCILGSRMLINLKEAGKIGVNEGTNYRTNEMSVMQFDPPAILEGAFSIIQLNYN